MFKLYSRLCGNFQNFTEESVWKKIDLKKKEFWIFQEIHPGLEKAKRVKHNFPFVIFKNFAKEYLMFQNFPNSSLMMNFF